MFLEMAGKGLVEMEMYFGGEGMWFQRYFMAARGWAWRTDRIIKPHGWHWR
jgi:hypothetical protein